MKRLLAHPLILPLYLPNFLVSLTWGIRNPILPLYAGDEFGATYALIGAIVAAERIGMLIADVPSGLVLARLGQRRAMMAGLAAAAVTSLALVWARTIPEVFVYRFVTGFGFAIFNVARHAYIAERITAAERGRSVAFFGGMLRLGRFAGPALGGAIAFRYGLRLPFAAMGAITLVTLVVVWVSVRDLPATHDAPSVTLGAYSRELWHTLWAQWRVLRTAGFGFLLGQIVRAGPDVIIPLYAADILGLDAAQIGVVMSVVGFIDMLFFYPAGIIMDRFGRKAAIVPAFLFQGLGVALIPLSTGALSLTLIASLAGLSNGLSSGTMMTLGADLAPVRGRGSFLGLWHLVGDSGSALGPLVIGGVAGAFALPIAALTIGGSGLATALVFVLGVRETLGKREK